MSASRGAYFPPPLLSRPTAAWISSSSTRSPAKPSSDSGKTKTIKVHWQYYPATKPEGDEATAMKKARILFESRFGGYQVPPGEKWGEILASQWRGVANIMQAEKLLPADFTSTLPPPTRMN